MRYGIHCLTFLSFLCMGCNAPQPHQDPDLVFRFALQPDPQNKAWVAADAVRRELESRSNGRIHILFYDSGTLGAERELLEQCYFGVLEMVQCTSSVVTTIDPVFSILDMPYLFTSDEHQQAVFNGSIGRELLDGLRNRGLQGLAFYSCGFRHLFNSVRPIMRTEDLHDLKIRVMESPVMLQSLNAMGASATPLSAAEVYTALTQKVVDGAENNPQVFISAHYSDACKYFSLTRHFSNQHVLVANRDWFDHLPEDFQTMIRQAAREVIPFYNQRWNEAVHEAMVAMKTENVTVNEIPDIEPFVARVQPVYDAYSQTVPPELVKRIRAIAGKDSDS